MLIGFKHLHMTLAYVLFLVALGDVVLALAGARTNARLAGVLRWAHSIGVLMAGRLNLVLGIALMVLMPQYEYPTWWMWVSVLLWGPVEVAAKRLVKPEIQAVLDGGQGGSRVVAGTAVQLVMVVVIFGLMSVRP